ncbi:MAG: transcription antitermination factor NusB [Candidatus Hydrogenedentes bacterium]|nr:transcription antitermination factor NusB [Candidatus Hydrogenedentota bacterium]
MKPKPISPRKRRQARECAVQFLFGLEFTKREWQSAVLPFWAGNPVRAPVKEYAEHLIGGVLTHREALDDTIARVVTKWAPDRVGRIERNILRVALFEMRFADDVPPKVAINEAVEIAKKFGDDEVPRFVNGVLDRLAKEKQ